MHENIQCSSNNDSVKDNAIKLVAAYNAVVLKAAKLMGGDVRAICKNGIQVVCNYVITME
jgi:flagellar capping protein FliD